MKKSSESKPYKFNQSQLKWLEALESGNYKRCIGKLCNISNSEESFCCLGVASELLCSQENKVDKEDCRHYENEDVYAPLTVASKLKLNNSIGTIATNKIKGYRKKETSLTQFNDSGMTFKEIAKFIRKHPYAVFKS